LPVSKPLPSTDTAAAIANPKSRARWRLMVDLVFFASMLASFALMAAQASPGRADDAHPNPPTAAAPPSPEAPLR
jgi:hypothetical protein